MEKEYRVVFAISQVGNTAVEQLPGVQSQSGQQSEEGMTLEVSMFVCME
ncbi:MAG: hypothetical protein OXC84_06330 [Gammaproteobacteria bacterium]|nr:hypothetical protein [Gammaproteobacteria bacterium]